MPVDDSAARPGGVTPPPVRNILIATAAAAVAAAIILVVAVLPAEYGIDPLGTGRLLGLTDLAGGSSGAITRQDAAYKTNTASFELGPYEFVEFKYRLEQGATMVYSWTATGPVIYDFHSEPDGAPAGTRRASTKPRRPQRTDRTRRPSRDSRLVLGKPRDEGGHDLADHRRVLYNGAGIPRQRQLVPPAGRYRSAEVAGPPKGDATTKKL